MARKEKMTIYEYGYLITNEVNEFVSLELYKLNI